MCDSSDCVMEYVQKKRDVATLGRAPNPHIEFQMESCETLVPYMSNNIPDGLHG